MIETILSYVSIWAPALVSILSMVAVVCHALAKTKNAVNELKTDNAIKEKLDHFDELAAQNEELVRCNKLLLEQITKIKGYADIIKEEQK